jgi:uncharacterized membrane protein YciS (DUF1049 family)
MSNLESPREPSKLDWILAMIFSVGAIVGFLIYAYFQLKKGPAP